jgi:lactam utilization protein B
MKKYRLSDETRLWQWKNGETTHATLRQIIATADFNDVTVGTKGGWIDDERAGRRLLDLR